MGPRSFGAVLYGSVLTAWVIFAVDVLAPLLSWPWSGGGNSGAYIAVRALLGGNRTRGFPCKTIGVLLSHRCPRRRGE